MISQPPPPSVLPVAAQRGGFKLRQRAEHVYGEAARPDAFAAVCQGGQGEEVKLQQLGRLMDESQASCRCVCGVLVCFLGKKGELERGDVKWGVWNWGEYAMCTTHVCCTRIHMHTPPSLPQSHTTTTTRDLYECSCKELDTLVGIAKQAGALGARLTGAGWGGCTVSLVPEGQVEGFINTLKQQYYEPLVQQGRLAKEGVEEAVFATKPACGGGVLALQF